MLRNVSGLDKLKRTRMANVAPNTSLTSTSDSRYFTPLSLRDVATAAGFAMAAGEPDSSSGPDASSIRLAKRIESCLAWIAKR
jgi:hypothetical protein